MIFDGIVLDFLHSFQILSQFGIEVIGGDLVILAILEVSLSVEEPKGDAISFWSLNDFSDFVSFIVSEFTCSSV